MNHTRWLVFVLVGNVVGILFGTTLGIRMEQGRTWERIARLQAVNDKNAADALQLKNNVRETISANAALESQWEARIKQSESDYAKCVSTLESYKAADGTRELQDRFYTMVYEPGASQSPDAAPLELLNLLRPGLGTALAKLQPASLQSASGVHLAYVLQGYVRPAVKTPDGVRFVYTLDPTNATNQAVN